MGQTVAHTDMVDTLEVSWYSLAKSQITVLRDLRSRTNITAIVEGGTELQTQTSAPKGSVACRSTVLEPSTSLKVSVTLVHQAYVVGDIAVVEPISSWTSPEFCSAFHWMP